MKITADSLKKTLESKGYKWYTDRPNIVGIRSAVDVPDTFNDLLLVVWSKDGKEEIKTYAITTDPGVHYQKKLLNAKGCAVLKPGQYVDAYSLGFHQSKPTHKALVQTKAVTVYRDNDMDGKIDTAGMKEDTGLFGVNIHGASAGVTTQKVGPWSAGCQVFSKWSEKEELVAICEVFKKTTNNRFTYTLLNEKDVIA